MQCVYPLPRLWMILKWPFCGGLSPGVYHQMGQAGVDVAIIGCPADEAAICGSLGTAGIICWPSEWVGGWVG